MQGHFTGSTALKNISFPLCSCGSSFWGWSWWRWGTARGGACEAWYVWWYSFYFVFCLMHWCITDPPYLKLLCWVVGRPKIFSSNTYFDCATSYTVNRPQKWFLGKLCESKVHRSKNNQVPMTQNNSYIPRKKSDIDSTDHLKTMIKKNISGGSQ